MAQQIRKLAETITLAKQYVKAMRMLGAKSIRLEAGGTWEDAKDRAELIFASGTHVEKLGRDTVRARVDGRTITMRPCTFGDNNTGIFVIAEL